MHGRSFLRLSCLLLTIFLIAIPNVSAQSTTTGAITGRVVDPTRAIIRNATILLKNDRTAARQTAATGSTGGYRFAFLDPGNYTVSATAPGFETVIQQVTVRVGLSKTLDFQLPVGQAKQTVTVSSRAALIQTTNGNVSATITPVQGSEIPNPGNDLTFIAQMAPGTVMNTERGDGNISFYGLPATSNLFTVNGMNDMSPLLSVNNSGATNLMLGLNDIEEATVVTNGYSGEYGGLAGANINYVTKAGANAFHGNANYYWNGSALDANSFFNNAIGTPRPFVNANQWSTSLGGPIIKDKAFFFIDQEGLRVLIPTSVEAQVPTQAFEQATLANLSNLGLNASIPFYQKMFKLYNNAPGANRAQDVLPNHGCSNVTALPAGIPCVLAYRSTVGQLTDQWILASRLDFNLTSADQVFVHGEIDRGHQATYTDPISPVFNIVSNQPEEQGQVGWTHVLGNKKVNSLRATLQYDSAIFGPSNRRAALEAFPTTMYFYDGSLTTLGGADYAYPQGTKTTQYQFIDDFSWLHGNHDLKFGINYARSDMSDYDFGLFSSGVLSVFSLNEFYNGGATGDLLEQTFPSALVQPFAFYRLGFYAQDGWHVRPNLAVMLTLRTDHASNPVCQHNCFARFSQPFPVLNHDVSIPYNQAILADQHQELTSLTALALQPRLGFAWQPFGGRHSIVLRGGAGFFSGGIPGLSVEAIADNPPNLNEFLVFDDNISPAEASNLFADAANSNAAFVQAFANGGTLASIRASLPNFAPPNATSTAQTIRLPQYQEWNLEVQKAFGRNTLVSLNYVGNHGIHEVIPNTAVNAYSITPFAGLPFSPPDPRFGRVTYVESAGVSSYNGLTASIRHNFSKGLLEANYTYGHSLDMLSNGGTMIPFIFATNESILSPQNPYNIRDNYGNADYDVRHDVNLSYVLGLPIRRLTFGHGGNVLVQGWQISGTLFAHSGFPYTVQDAQAESTLQAEDFGGPLYATFLGGPTAACNSLIHPCLMAAQFQASTNNPTHFGIQGRNSFRGPGYFDTDFAITKATSLPGWESVKLILGFQFFNVLNHPNFDQPIANLFSTQFGRIINTVSSPTSIFGSGLGADASPRLIQVHAQLTF